MRSILCTSLVALASAVFAHVDDTIYPAWEISTSLLPDLHDGSLDDWGAFAPEASLLPDAFLSDSNGIAVDPEDIDFRIYLGWHAGTGRVFVGAQVVDDVRDVESTSRWHDEVFDVYIDGDHSGGPGFVPNPPTIDNMGPTALSNLQPFFIGIDDSAVFLDGGFSDAEADWLEAPPFADGSVSALRGSPESRLFEFCFTPFDSLDVLRPEASRPSALVAGNVVGLHVGVRDFDGDGQLGRYFTIGGTDRPHRTADRYADVELIGCDQPDCGEPRQVVSAVRANSWGRIKASLTD